MEDGFGVAGLNCLKLTDKSRQVRLVTAGDITADEHRYSMYPGSP